MKFNKNKKYKFSALKYKECEGLEDYKINHQWVNFAHNCNYRNQIRGSYTNRQ